MAQTNVATIDQEIAAQRKKSVSLYAKAKEVFPGGVTHDGRYMEMAPMYITHAKGSRKWDVDGNEYVDYFGGHGALILGHAHPAVTAAVLEQVPKGSHYGSNHELEIQWGDLVRQIVPSARGGQVKFVSSGTEATLMAMRMARAYTGKEVIVKMKGHFHGWHDYATVGMAEPYDVPISMGIPKAVQDSMRTIAANDIPALEAALAPGDVASVILLQNGLSTEYLQKVRDITTAKGVILIFDEVVTGFRWAPGGAQEYFGVTPDITTLAKILAGGYPGGAICGKSEYFRVFDHFLDPDTQRFKRIAHPGTFNANPVSAAAGVACLSIVKDPAIQKKATATGDAIRKGMTESFTKHGVAGSAGGEVSMVAVKFDKPRIEARQLLYKFRGALQLQGVDTSGQQFIVSAVHDERDVDVTVKAFDRTLQMLQSEGAL